MNQQTLLENREMLDYYNKGVVKPYVETFDHKKKQDLTRSPYSWAGIYNHLEKREFKCMRDIQEEILKFSQNIQYITGKEVIVKYHKSGSVTISPSDIEIISHGIEPYMIFEVVVLYFKIDKEDFLTDKRHRKYVEARKIISYLLRKYCPKFSLKSIGKMLNRDHSSVVVALGAVKRFIDTNDEDFMMKLNACEAVLLEM